MSIPSLLVAGNLAAAPGKTRDDLKSKIPMDYITEYCLAMQKISVPTIGDRILVLQSATGSGKSVIMPPALAMVSLGKLIGMVQPTKINTQGVPYNIASMKPNVFKMGENIGYQHGDSRVDVKAVFGKPAIKCMTTMVLTNIIRSRTDDQICRQYAFISVDEIHLHDLPIDLLLFDIYKLLERCYKRPDCPIIILTSATMDPKLYMDYYASKHYIKVEGTSAKIIDQVPKQCLTGSVVENISKIVLSNLGIFKHPNNDIMCVFPSMANMASAILKPLGKMIEGAGQKIEFIEISSTHPNGDLARVPVKDPKMLRMFCTTPVIETGFTAPFAKMCIDTGLARFVIFNSANNHKLDYLGLINMSSILQRKGRVGRTQDGYWFPLFNQGVLEMVISNNYPEIYRTDLANEYMKFVIRMFELKEDMFYNAVTSKDHKMIVKWHSHDILNYIRLINKPTSEALVNTINKLVRVGAIGSNLQITELGVIMNSMPKFMSMEMFVAIYEAQVQGIPVNWLVKVASFFIVMRDRVPDSRGLGFKKEPIFKVVQNILGKSLPYMDDFLNLVVIFEHYQSIISDEKKLIGALEDKNMQIWFKIMIIYHNLTKQLAKVGIMVDKKSFNNTYKELMSISQKSILDELVCKFKTCLYKGFINNLFKKIKNHNDIYETAYQKNHLYFNYGRPIEFGITSSFLQELNGCENTVLNASITAPKCLLRPALICKLDGYVNI
jgi:HrpA-like RNA helicase